MSRILMVTWDGGGNVPPMLQIGLELQERGHEVKVLGHAAQRASVESRGLAFRPFRCARAFSRVAPYAEPIHFFQTFVDDGPGRDLDELLDDWPADIAVIDCLMLGALQGAQVRGLPTIVLIHSFWSFFGERFMQTPITEMGAAVGRAPLDLWASATEVLVASDRELDPVAGPVPPNVRWTGVAQPRATPATRADRSRILLSLSTVWFPGQEASMQRLFDAIAELPVRVLATTDPSLGFGRLRIPENVRELGFVDHGEVMPSVAMVIGHGGHATTMYALAHDLPVLVVPQFAMIDQPLIGEVLAAHGAGRILGQHPAIEDVRQAVSALLQDDSTAAAVAAIGARLRADDGARCAADRIELAVGVGTPS
jgi:UDP:flavonoid glycosyltransferase YjiC (YdhE family)